MPNLVGTGLNQVPTNGMLGGLAYQSPDHASIKDLDLKNLSQINSEIADTAVDIFIYDTSKDSDGGAWRHRTSHTSWYNETLNTATRGSRKEFPAVAVIVATTSKVTIYDGDDPDMPMWMVFEGQSGGNTVDSKMLQYAYTNGYYVHALNGILVIGQKSSADNYGSPIIRFISEYVNRMDAHDFEGGVWNGNIADRNSTVGYRVSASETYVILNSIINDVAMTVLPNAPIDDATGLPIPTIAVATNGGVSVIADNGNVYDVTGFYPVQQTGFSDDKLFIHTMNGTTSYAAIGRRLLTADIGLNDWEYGDQFNTGYAGVNYIPPSHTKAIVTPSNELVLGGGSTGLFKIQTDDQVETNGDASNEKCEITTSYNTGWMHGNIKGAFLSDTDATNVTAGSNLITSGDFSSSTGWNLGTGWVISGGKLSKTTTDNNTASYTATGLTIGKAYTFSINVDTLGSGTIYFYTLGQFSVSLPTTGTHSVTVVATSSTLDFGITGISGNGCVLDNASLTVGEADRSVNNKGLQVFGTVNKSAVATGAELVAYSGFSVSNYLQQPYNSDLNFGTGDFFLSIWLNPSSTSSEQYIIDKRSGGVDIFELRLLSGGTLRLYVSVSSAVVYYDSSSSLPLNTWSLVQLVRPTGGDLSIYINGVERTNKAYSSFIGQSLTTSCPVTLGLQVDSSGSPATNLKMSLLRISTSAPSAEQIKKIYEDEKVLFQENAACTLYGSSDAVTALAYDEVTQRLHVGTSSGRSEFQGLRRINNTTTAVTTAISAYDSFVVEQ